MNNDSSNSNYDVTSLLEMGISRDVAIDAMKRVDGNLEAAVNFIFSNESGNNNGNGYVDLTQSKQSSTNPFRAGDLSKYIPQGGIQDDNSGNSSNNNNLSIGMNAFGKLDENFKSIQKPEYSNSDLTPPVSISSSPSPSSSPSGQDTSSRPDLHSSLSSSTSSSSESSSNASNDSSKNDYPSYTNPVSTHPNEQPVPEPGIPSRNNPHTYSSSTLPPPPAYHAIQHSHCKKDINDPTIITPIQPPSSPENYLALFALSVANFLPKPFIVQDFKDLNYQQAWFTGDKLLIEKNASDKRLKMLWQLQRLISVVIPRFSERAFVSANLFALGENYMNFENDDDNYDDDNYDDSGDGRLYDLLPRFVKLLLAECCRGNSNSDDSDSERIRELFVSKATYTVLDSSDDDDDNNNDKENKGKGNSNGIKETDLMLFHFLPEEYDSNLYKMFNALLFPSEDSDDDDNDDDNDDYNDDITSKIKLNSESEPENSLKSISPFMTILFNELDDTTEEEPVSLPHGVDIPFEFYPQLYTTECKSQLIRHIITKRKIAKRKLRSTLADLSQLRSFNGKDIDVILSSTQEFLERDANDSPLARQLAEVKARVNSMKQAKKAEYNKILDQLHTQWDLAHPELSIVETAKSLNLIDEPYLLTMCVISPYLYYMRDRKDLSKWVVVQCNSMGTDFRVIRPVGDREIKEHIRNFTRTASRTPIMFTYVKRSFILDQDALTKALKENEGCYNFHKSDQTNLLSSS